MNPASESGVLADGEAGAVLAAPATDAAVNFVLPQATGAFVNVPAAETSVDPQTSSAAGSLEPTKMRHST